MFYMPETARPLILRGLLRGLRRWLATAAAVLAFSAAHASPDVQAQDLTTRLMALQTTLKDPASASLSGTALIATTGLKPLLATPIATGIRPLGAQPNYAPLASDLLNMRLGLTMISQAYGADDNIWVIAAQPAPDGNALVIRSGNATLSDLGHMLTANHLQSVGPGPLTLKVPLIIWQGAGLRLGPGEVLHLSRADGAFIVNFGTLDLQGATIDSTGVAPAASPNFVPFVTTADNGTFTLKAAHLAGLGFGNTMKYAGFSVMGNVLRTVQRPSRVDDSSFDNLMTVAISAAHNVTLQGNHFHNMRGPGLVISRSRDAHVLANLFSGSMVTNAIRLESGSTHGQIAGNVVLSGDRAGIVVRDRATDAQVTGNLIWHRKGSGITLAKTDCSTISGNIIVDNAQKGIEVRFAQGVQVTQNTLLNNHNAGVWISAQAPGAATYLTQNLLVANGSGLAAANGADIHLDGNDFTRQFPQFLSGDLTPQSQEIAQNLKGATPFILSAAGRRDADAAASPCTP